MAKSNVFLLSILLMALLSSISHSLQLFGLDIGEVNIRGDLRCSLNGDPNAPPVSNATVILVCDGTNTTLAEAVTDPNGAFTFVLNTLETTLFRPSDCGVVANLPAGSCLIAPPDGTLTASLNLFSVIFTSVLIIANYVTGPFLDMTV